MSTIFCITKKYLVNMTQRLSCFLFDCVTKSYFEITSHTVRVCAHATYSWLIFWNVFLIFVWFLTIRFFNLFLFLNLFCDFCLLFPCSSPYHRDFRAKYLDMINVMITYTTFFHLHDVFFFSFLPYDFSFFDEILNVLFLWKHCVTMWMSKKNTESLNTSCPNWQPTNNDQYNTCDVCEIHIVHH